MKQQQNVWIVVALALILSMLIVVGMIGCNGPAPTVTVTPSITPIVITVTATVESPLPTPIIVSPLPTPTSIVTHAVKSVENTPRQLQSQEEPSTMDFKEVVINGVPLLVLIIGLVQFAKEMGLGGKALRITSALLGLGFGVAYQVSLGAPTDFAGWLGVTVYGLGLGVTASGLVDAARRIAGRA